MRFELRANEYDASNKKGVAGSPGKRTPSAASITHKMPRTIKKMRINSYRSFRKQPGSFSKFKSKSSITSKNKFSIS